MKLFLAVMLLSASNVAAQGVVFQTSVVPKPEEDILADCRYEIRIPNPAKPILSAGETVEDATRAFEFREALLFFTKFARMGDHGAARAASGMLDVQHLVEQDIFHGARWNAWTIHAAIQQNLIRAGIEAAELPPPASRAPANVRTLQLAGKIFSIQVIEERVQIEMVPARVRRGQANASAAHAVHAGARAIRARIIQIRFGEFP